jgi:hypothetical protein
MPAVLRSAGLDVVEYDGWQTRSRSSGGYDGDRPWCVMWHHTASQTTPANDASYMCHGSDARPIANLLIDRAGLVWVLAAGATNTNGEGDSMLFSRGVVPASQMNTHAIGVELANAGIGELYPQVQIDAAFAASLAMCAHHGLEPDDAATHNEYAPQRKIDPATASAVLGPWQPSAVTSSGTWSADDLRAELWRRSTGPPLEDDTVTDEDVERIAKRAAELVWAKEIDTTTGDEQTPQPARFLLDRTYKTVQRLDNRL